ncbi:MAG: hypothetical protein LBL04_04680 [Bacteroidales bacterium]|jgi:hypothetical protein|nr:hypothetical protein [Bacteroidales bacterium]
MKKVSFLAVTAIAATMGLNSCSSDDPAQPLNVDWNQTATVHGKLLIRNDFVDATPKWTTASDVKFVATVDYAQLASGAEGTYIVPGDKITYDGRTGEVTVVFPVSRMGTQLSLKLLDFTGSVKISDGNGGSKTVDVIWKGTPTSKTSDKMYPGDVGYLTNWQLQGYTQVVKEGDAIN